MVTFNAADRVQPEHATGLVTFLFTDIEGSSRLWDEQPAAMRTVLAHHDALVREAIEAHGGHVFKTIGDAFCAAFSSATAAVAAAATAQAGLQGEEWSAWPESDGSPEMPRLKVRMALHAGEAQLRDGDYFGPPLNRASRLLAAAHGGQVIISSALEEVLANQLPRGVQLLDLGEHRLRDLARPARVYQMVADGLAGDFPPLRTLASHPNNLPIQLTSFIGREREAADVKTMLSTTRLLTLTGVGGAGKTRLALQVAADVVAAYPDGVWFVELAALEDPGLVAPTVASALGLREEAGRAIEATLSDYLKPRDLLLVLDNCEHLLEPCARLADQLLRASAKLTLLATSREALGIAGEACVPVPSLSLPTTGVAQTVEALTQYEAVRLFIERALSVQPNFKVTNQNAPAVAQICARLDGIPLALELAAARVRLLSPDQIAERLNQRFRLLTGGSRTVLPRQQTLQAAIDWSYDLLDEKERELLARLSVFRGGWTLEAAEAVCGETVSEDGPGRNSKATSKINTPSLDLLEVLGHLVDKSLVAQELESDGSVRFRFLETIRHYASEKLEGSGQAEALRLAHLDFFVRVAEESEPGLKGPDQARVLERLEADHDNLRAAVERAVGLKQSKEGARLGTALWYFWMLRGHLSEGRTRLAEVLALPAGSPFRERGGALNGAGGLAYMQGDYAAAGAYYEESLITRRFFGDNEGVAATLANLGNLAHDQGGHSGARDFYEESLAIFRAVENEWGMARCLGNLASLANDQLDFDSAWALHEESLAIRRRLGDRHGIASSLQGLGLVAHRQEDNVAARACQVESLAIRRELGDRQGVAASLGSLGDVARAQGNLAEARLLLDESLAIRRELRDMKGTALSLYSLAIVACEQAQYARARSLLNECLAIGLELGTRPAIAECIEGHGWLAACHGHAQRAVRLLGAAEDFRDSIGAALAPADEVPRHAQAIAAARDALSYTAFDDAWAKGQAMSWEEAVAYALEEEDVGP